MEVKELTVKPITVLNIESNFNEVKESLELILKGYQGLTFDENEVKSAKKSRAELNKLKKAINDKKITVKKEYLAPYTDFENKVKILMGLVDEPCLLIDTQVKGFEEKQKLDKGFFLENMIDDIKGTLEVSIDVREEWLNASFSNNKIKEEVTAICDNFVKNMEAMKMLNSEFSEELSEVIINGGDMADVTIELTRLKMLQDKFKEKEVIKQEELKELQEEVKETTVEQDYNEAEDTKEFTFTLKITCSVEQSEKLKQFMQENNIKAERIV